MPVPLQFYAGFLFDDEARLTFMDWQRNERKWKTLDEIDDAERFIPCTLPKLDSSEIVLAVSISYEVDYEAIEPLLDSADSGQADADPAELLISCQHILPAE